MNNELHYEVTQFYHKEAYLLDHREYEKWLDTMTEDIIYRMPLRITADEKDGKNLVDDMAYFEETKVSLNTRVKRLRTTSAWAENPATRGRHLITNILIEQGDNESQELQVRTAFLYMRSRGSDLNTEHLYGERLDVLKKVNGAWQLAARTIYPDQTVLTVKNLSMFL